MRSSSLLNPDIAFDREIDSTYDEIRAIADNLIEILAVNTAIQNGTILDVESIEDNLLSVNPTKVLSANQGSVLKGLIDGLNSLLTSDDISLNEIQEIVTFIKTNRAMIETLTAEGMVKSIYDVLGTGVVDNAEKVNGLTVKTAVPLGALFTDTNTETTTTLSLATNILSYVDEEGITTNLDLSLYLDDTNLAYIANGVLDGDTGIATFTRSDATTFTVDLSALLDDTKVTVNNTLISISTTQALSAAQGKVLKDVQDTQQAAIALNTAKVSNVDHPLVATAVPIGALFTDTVYDDTDIQADVLGNTISIDVVIQSIANLASAQGSIINAVTPSVSPIPVAPTVSILDFTEVDASTDSTVFEFDDVANTVTFKKAGSYNFTSSVTVESSTSISRNITFELIDTSDDSVVTTQIATVEVPNGKKANFPLNTLVVVDTVPLTVRVEASADGTGYALDSFSSVLVSMVNFIAELPTDILRDTDIGVTVEPYTDKAIVAENNAIDFTKKNFELTATAANITATGLTGTFPREGTIIVHSAENITGWGTEFKFKTVPTDLTGDETFGYFIEDATNIWIGRVQ